MNTSVLRLFKALPLVNRLGVTNEISGGLTKKTIKHGFIFSPEVASGYSETELEQLVDAVSNEVGLSAEKANTAFHKSWKKVRDADIEQLVIEQILHYITTYGFEAMGIYRSDTVYIPVEKLEIPKIKLDKISLIVIKGYTKEELKQKLISLLGSGIALKEDTKKDVIDVVTFVEFSEKEIYNIMNKEVRVALYDYLDICPEDAVEFLRYMIYKATNKTLLIKDRMTITDIKAKDNLSALRLLEKYQQKYGLNKLAEIFYRFKPLFLAFRTNKKLKTTINKIRKLAVKNHRPMREDYLNAVTAKIKRGESLGETKLISELSGVNVFRKIRLAYALKYRTRTSDSILYRIRNGKSYATSFDFKRQEEADRVLGIVLGSIVKDFRVQVDGKKIYIPKNIHYALPTTEKQFTGDFPSGTYVSIPKDAVVGVHWTNVGSNRIDLDLSLMKCDGGKIGWDGYYRSEGGDVLFSGDITDAPKPNGASELFYVQKQKDASYLLMVNYFNYSDYEKLEVPFTIIAASEAAKNMGKNYMVNPNNVVCVAKSKITQKQKMLGLLVTTPKECRFYFAEAYIGNSITSYSSAEYVDQSRKYLFDFYTNTISLNDILQKAGAELVDSAKDCDIDLSYEKMEKDSLLKLMTK